MRLTPIHARTPEGYGDQGVGEGTSGGTAGGSRGNGDSRSRSSPSRGVNTGRGTNPGRGYRGPAPQPGGAGRDPGWNVAGGADYSKGQAAVANRAEFRAQIQRQNEARRQSMRAEFNARLNARREEVAERRERARTLGTWGSLGMGLLSAVMPGMAGVAQAGRVAAAGASAYDAFGGIGLDMSAEDQASLADAYADGLIDLDGNPTAKGAELGQQGLETGMSGVVASLLGRARGADAREGAPRTARGPADLPGDFPDGSTPASVRAQRRRQPVPGGVGAAGAGEGGLSGAPGMPVEAPGAAQAAFSAPTPDLGPDPAMPAFLTRVAADIERARRAGRREAFV